MELTLRVMLWSVVNCPQRSTILADGNESCTKCSGLFPVLIARTFRVTREMVRLILFGPAGLLDQECHEGVNPWNELNERGIGWQGGTHMGLLWPISIVQRRLRLNILHLWLRLAQTCISSASAVRFSNLTARNRVKLQHTRSKSFMHRPASLRFWDRLFSRGSRNGASSRWRWGDVTALNVAGQLLQGPEDGIGEESRFSFAQVRVYMSVG